MNLTLLGDEKQFEKMCQALLDAECERFQPYSAPDWGMDGVDLDTGTIFQAYFPERAPRRDKVRADLAKARSHPGCTRWVLLLPKNPSADFMDWIERSEQPSCAFRIEVWGETKISALLRKHNNICEQYFPSEWRRELRRIVKGKGPREDDAGPGLEISAEEAEELRQSITKLAEEEARRKRRPVKGSDFQREYSEFNAFFRVSIYHRLPREKMGEARSYLETKMYARREREPIRSKRNRMVGGIKHIAKSLAMTEAQYRQLLADLTGKRSTKELNMKDLSRVFNHFRQLQGQAESSR